MNRSRRQFLRGGAVVVGGTLAGCVGSIGGGSGGGLTLRSLDVAGSPGGEVPVDPAGGVALIDFFGTWCAPCKPQMKHLRRIHERYPDVHMISITTERDEAAVKDFWRKYDGTWPVALDPKVKATSKYGADNVPTMVVTDADGTETWRHRGLVAAEKIATKLEAAGATPE